MAEEQRERTRLAKPQPMDTYLPVYAKMPDETQGDHFRYCPGCGLGIAQSAIMRAFAQLALDPAKIVTIGGSGCYAVMGHYLANHVWHGGHGRACAVATGVKMSDPELTVVCLQGDGDGLAIGAPHFVHAARRNIDITVVIFNNFVYGETGGQHGPTTPPASITETSPYGMVENPFDVVQLALGAGATYAARTTVYHTHHMTKSLVNAIEHPGFAVVEILQNCHELWGKRNGMPTATAMLEWYRDNSVMAAAAGRLAPEDRTEKFILGEWRAPARPELSAEWARTIARARSAAP